LPKSHNYSIYSPEPYLWYSKNGSPAQELSRFIQCAVMM
jgi:hypothetical protein